MAGLDNKILKEVEKEINFMQDFLNFSKNLKNWVTKTRI